MAEWLIRCQKLRLHFHPCAFISIVNWLSHSVAESEYSDSFLREHWVVKWLINLKTNLRNTFQFIGWQIIWMSPSIANLKADLSKPRSYWIRCRAPDSRSGCQLAWCQRWVGVAIKNIILYAWKQTTVMINTFVTYMRFLWVFLYEWFIILSLAMYAKSSSSRVGASWKYTITSVILLGNHVRKLAHAQLKMERLSEEDTFFMPV